MRSACPPPPGGGLPNMLAPCFLVCAARAQPNLCLLSWTVLLASIAAAVYATISKFATRRLLLLPSRPAVAAGRAQRPSAGSPSIGLGRAGGVYPPPRTSSPEEDEPQGGDVDVEINVGSFVLATRAGADGSVVVSKAVVERLVEGIATLGWIDGKPSEQERPLSDLQPAPVKQNLSPFCAVSRLIWVRVCFCFSSSPGSTSGQTPALLPSLRLQLPRPRAMSNRGGPSNPAKSRG